MSLENKRYWQLAADTAYQPQVVLQTPLLIFLHSELANQLPHLMLKYFNTVLFSFTSHWITCASIPFLFGVPTPFATYSLYYKETQQVTYFHKTCTSSKQENRKKPLKNEHFLLPLVLSKKAENATCL